MKQEDMKVHIENFCLNVFAKVDNDERTAETITKKNAMDFNRASHFIELISCFGPLEKVWEEKRMFDHLIFIRKVLQMESRKYLEGFESRNRA